MEKTEYTDVFGRARWPGAPHRVLKTPFFMDWKTLPSHENESNQPIIGHSTVHGIVRSPFPEPDDFLFPSCSTLLYMMSFAWISIGHSALHLSFFSVSGSGNKFI